MNIWFISKYASPPKYANVSSRPFSLSKEIMKLGHQVTIITSDANHFTTFPKSDKIYNYEEQENVPFYWVKTRKYTKTASVSRILSWLDFELKLFFMNLKKMQPPNVVVVSSLSIFTIVYGFYLKKKFGCFLAFEIRDIWPLTMTEEGGFSKWHPLVLLIGFIEKFGYKHSDLIIGTMPGLDLHVEQILGYSKPFLCSPLGFDPLNYEKKDLTQENPFNGVFPDGKTVIGYAGSMGITNALEPFIDTIKLMKENTAIHFMIVGGGDLKNTFMESLKDCSNVTFLDRIKQSEVKYFLNKCDILYLSTQNSKVWDYGQSMNKIVEYMLASKPIIATYSGFPSMINEAKCGVFVKSTDPLDIKQEILNFANLSKEDRKLIGENGRKWILENRNYTSLAKQYLNAMPMV
jgi:glycosyltransferase involved in cell wall biosynthesis